MRTTQTVAATTRWTPAILSRLAGLSILGAALGELLYTGFISPPLGPPEPSSDQILSWVASNQQVLLFQFIIGYVAILFAVFIFLLVQLCGARGVLANLAYMGVVAWFAMSLTAFGLYLGLWTFIQRGGSGQDVVALYTMGESAEAFAHAGEMALGLSAASVSAIALKSHSLPRWLIVLGLLTGFEQLFTNIAFASFPAFSTTSVVFTPGTFARVLDISLVLVWFIVIGIYLLVKPIRGIPKTQP